MKELVMISLILAMPGCKEDEPAGRGDEQAITIFQHDTIPAAKDSSLPVATFDSALYESRLAGIVHNKPSGGWPVKQPYPLPGAVLPYKRVVAFYGNFYSAGMGILGELSPGKMLAKLNAECQSWQQADTTIPVQPALHYIAVTAQDQRGKGNKYRLRMPPGEIEKVLKLAEQANAIVFLDVQVGHSTLQQELPALEKYLKLEKVHLGIDPEYSMKGGQVPSTAIGSFDAADINYASQYLADLVKKHNLPPKMLIVHRFTQGMVTNFKKIVLHPEVQVVMNMDGFGSPAKKKDSYDGWLKKQPVQYTGFKLFYKQDKPLMKPSDVLKLYPRPVYIQYQ